MPKPHTKPQLLADIQHEWNALVSTLDTLSSEHMLQPNIVGVWSVKDVLAHLIEWQQMVLGWYQTGQDGNTPALPAEGYKWNQLPALNQHIYEKHKARPLSDIQTQFHASHQQIVAFVQTLSDEQLFAAGHFDWAGSNAMSSYINSCTASHYRWARKEIRKGFRRLK